MFFAKSCWDIDIRAQCYGYVHCFFFFLFIFIHVRFEGNNKYAKKVLSQPWNSLTLQISLSLRGKHDKIVFTLQGYFGRSDNLFRSPRIFVISDKRSELPGCFLFKRLQRSEGIWIIFELIPSKELVFRVERPRSPLGRTKDSRESRDLRCLFAKNFWNMDTRTVLRILFSLLCVKYIFFWCYGSFRFEGNNKYARKVLRQPIGMRWPCNFPFRYVTDKILFTLQVYFDRSLPLKFSEYFSQFQTRKHNCRALLLKQVQRSEEKWNLCKPSKEHARITSLVGK